MSNFAKNLYHLRINERLSQRELADKLYVSNKTVSKWERGLSEPDLNMLCTVADFFNITTDELINGNLNGNGNAEDTPQDFSKYKKSAIALCIAVIAGYLLSVACYLIFSDNKFVFEHGYNGKWIGLGVYIAIIVISTILACIVFSVYGGEVRKSNCIINKRTYLKLIYCYSALVLYTVLISAFGQYTVNDIKQTILFELIFASVAALLIIEVFTQIYVYMAYRGADNSINVKFISSTIQWSGLFFSGALYAVYVFNYNGAQIVAPLYALAGMMFVIAPIIYYIVQRTNVNMSLVANFAVNTITFIAITLTPWLFVETDNALAALIILLCVLVLNTVYKLVVCSRLKRNDVD